MTTFSFEPRQVLVNAVRLSRYQVVVFLTRLLKQFPPPNLFSISDINSSQYRNYSEKTIRAMISLFLNLNYLQEYVETGRGNKLPKRFYFSNKSLADMILRFAEMGTKDNENEEKEV